MNETVATVVSVRAGRVRQHDRPEWDHIRSRDWRTAYWKDEGPGPVRIGALRREGVVTLGDEVRLVARPHPEWTIDRLMRLRYVSPRSPAEVSEASSLGALAADWRRKLSGLPARD